MQKEWREEEGWSQTSLQQDEKEAGDNMPCRKKVLPRGRGQIRNTG